MRGQLHLSRRRLLQTGSLLGAGSVIPACAAKRTQRVVVVGGGFAGVMCARTVKALLPGARVQLVEPRQVYTACPFSNLVLAGLRPLASQQFSYAGVQQSGVEVLRQRAVRLDVRAHKLELASGQVLAYDRLIAAPGIAMRWDALAGYNSAAAELMPHAWQAGAQTALLRRQLEAMPVDGVVAITVPEAPYRCPPGPYERASLIAHYLALHKPRARLLVLDAKDKFSKQSLFLEAWHQLYGERVMWFGAADGARVGAVDAARGILETDFDTHQVDVANVIPPQQAGAFAQDNDLVDATGWCPIEPLTFASTLQPDVHIIGDAAIANAMPKSAFAAVAQARLCAVQVIRSLLGEAPVSAKLLNTCYSLVAPDYGISVAGVYEPGTSNWRAVRGAGGISDLDAPAAARAQEARQAQGWFEHLTDEAFG